MLLKAVRNRLFPHPVQPVRFFEPALTKIAQAEACATDTPEQLSGVVRNGGRSNGELPLRELKPTC